MQSKGEHYFLLEMCYLVNVVLAVSVWLAPTNVWLYKAAFGLVAGPLTWSIVALRNSLVLHSLDQVRRALGEWSRVYNLDPRGGDGSARGAVTVV